ncbi:MAG: phosphocholine cytidylyltransferase family protein [Bacteroidales bacterium]|nr:phosphocholine cytidylyltransferase family protein [Bacteroidales bacterium]
MQALILAAGMGSRLQKYTLDKPKCLVEVNGVSLLKRIVYSLKLANVNKIVIVTGYKDCVLKSYIKENMNNIEVDFIHSADYAKTNNIYSVQLAQDILQRDDTILIESDLIYHPELISRIVEAEGEAIAAVARYKSWMDGTVVKLDKQQGITEFIEKSDFDHTQLETYYKTVNIYKFSKSFSQNKLVPFLNAFVQAFGKNHYYELVLKAITFISPGEVKPYVVEGKWYEIDDPDDLRVANELFANQMR